MSENNEIKEPLNKNNKVPKLRFNKFKNDNFNCDILSQIATLSKGNGLSKDDLSPDGNKCILYGELYTRYLGYIDTIISKTKTILSKPKLSKSGDIIMPLSGETPTDISNSAVVPEDNVILGGDLLVITPKKDIDPLFLSLYLSNCKRKEIAKKSCGISIIHSHKEDIAKLTINYPSSAEQYCISTFLKKLTKKIDIVLKKIDILKKYKEGIMIKCYELAKNPLISLSKLVKNNTILLGRGEIIPKQNGTFPVYSSSAANNGLFCFRNKYSFDEELITWSIDGGGKPFLRNKHKFSITNVCGYAKILDLNKFSYSWLYINFWNSWRKIKFDYTTKAHPSVIEKLYKIKPLDIESQMKIEKILTYINNKIDYLIKELNDVTLTKESLLRSLFF